MDENPHYPDGQPALSHSPKLINFDELLASDGFDTPAAASDPPPDISQTGADTEPPVEFALEKAVIEAGPGADMKRVMEIYQRQNEVSGMTTLFTIRSGAEWQAIGASKPMPRMLFDSMWLEGELCILFADTNVGKSILAVQLGDSISRGQPVPGFRMEAEAQPVAYFDFELTDKQFQLRYTSESGDFHPFSDTFFRAEINLTDDHTLRGFKSFESYLMSQLECYVINTRTKVIIIDNLSCLQSDTERARDATPLMRALNALKIQYGLSMLVLAHTPKRDQSTPIIENHLQGSKALSNLCDGIIAIGKSHRDNHLRYIKQIKGRTKAKQYEADNVCLCQVIKPHDFLHFELLGFCAEKVHLKETSDKELSKRDGDIIDLADTGMNQRDIAAQLGLSAATVNRCLKKLPPGILRCQDGEV